LNNENLIGLIPAAGSGTRLNLPFPKELYPTLENNKYKPVANHVVDNLLATGLKHIVFVINKTKHQLLGYFGSGMKFDCSFSYVVQEHISKGQSTSPGLADALSSAYHLIREKTVLFGMADTIMWPKDAFQKGLKSSDPKADVTLCLFPTKFPEKFGMVAFDQQNKVERIVDKPESTDLKFMWGCIIWKPVFTEYLFSKVRKEGISDFAKILNMAIHDRMIIKAVKFDQGKFIDFGTFEQIKQFDEEFGINLGS
jgi:glucose-1-phosphate thymidylyltransferase